jgi:hypothetical protein
MNTETPTALTFCPNQPLVGDAVDGRQIQLRFVSQSTPWDMATCIEVATGDLCSWSPERLRPASIVEGMELGEVERNVLIAALELVRSASSGASYHEALGMEADRSKSIDEQAKDEEKIQDCVLLLLGLLRGDDCTDDDYEGRQAECDMQDAIDNGSW